MASFLEVIFPCCMGRGRARRSGDSAARRANDERTPLLGDGQTQQTDGPASREQKPKSLLPQPCYDAEAMRGIVTDVQTKLISLDAPHLFAGQEAMADPNDPAAASGQATARPLTLVRNLKLHIAQEAALEDRLQREGKNRSPHPSTSAGGASSATHDLMRGGLRRKKTSGSDSRFPSVHSLKTLARGGGGGGGGNAAYQAGGETSPTDTEATVTAAAASQHNDDGDDSAFHTAKEALQTMAAMKEATAASRPKLVDIWGTSPPEKANKVETYASRARKALRKETLQPPNPAQAGDTKRKMTTTQAAEIESSTFDKLADTIRRQGPLTEVWGEDHED
ncbi:uncharacterized protein PFL1_04990 [Pseudozyma flocculosa PF-1]|uniref:Uncharacterized protein n=2 Tax=Pseudozyma flocculosa TaxID=84751 RepID=A0A5C3EYC7_9BASI|nr:uncharacterized protein PFL1_04990 [Pseudozyma flocculosa PF-1]EPQ27452.1 hypothetical protein PFL1_04990 [Pseudozyma flocculosa PF-1]SPO36119.1 uncharacterized protein PSFLO_01590 [Pseudozyma flocculosa]